MSTPILVLVARVETYAELARLALVADDHPKALDYIDQVLRTVDELRRATNNA